MQNDFDSTYHLRKDIPHIRGGLEEYVETFGS